MPRKGENIYKRKDKRWEARYVKNRNADGSAQYGYCYGKTYSEAKQKMLEAQKSLHTKKTDAKTTNKKRFQFYCDEWLLLNRNHVKEATHVKYGTILEKHIKPALGNSYAQSLSSVMIENFSHNLLYEKALSAKTVKDILTVLHSILQYTHKQYGDTLPIIEIIYPKQSSKEMRVLTREEQKNLLVIYLPIWMLVSSV